MKKVLFALLFAVGIILISGCVNPPNPVCGDNICEQGLEDNSSLPTYCAQDCTQQTFELKFMAKDVDGNPLAGAMIEVDGVNYGPTDQRSTDSEGSATFVLEPDTYLANVSLDGYYPKKEIEIVLKENQNFIVVLEKIQTQQYSAPSFDIGAGGDSHRVWANFKDGKGQLNSAQLASGFDNCFNIHLATYGEPVCSEGIDYNQGTNCRYYFQRNVYNSGACVLKLSYLSGDGSIGGSSVFESYSKDGKEYIREVICGNSVCEATEDTSNCPQDCVQTSSKVTLSDNLISATTPLEAGFNKTLTKTELTSLLDGEKLVLAANPRFNTASDVERMALDIDAGAFKYVVAFNAITPGTNRNIPLLGKLYSVISLKLDSAGNEQLVLGKESDLSQPVMTIFNNKGFPYDPNNTTGIYDWKAKLIIANDALTGIEISNSNQRWTDAKALDGSQTAQFTGGKYSITFNGFGPAQQVTEIKIGREQIGYADLDGVSHSIPMVYKGDASDDQWQAFTFDGKTINYQVDKTDTNFKVNSGNIINGRQWIIDSNSIIVAGIRQLGNPSGLSVDGVTYNITGRGPNFVWLSTSGKIQFLKNSTTRSADSLAYIGDFNTTSPGYGYVYYTDGQVWDPRGEAFKLEGANSQTFKYALQVREGDSKLWLVMANQEFITQLNKKIVFDGTDAGEDAMPETKYYRPDDAAFGGDAADNTFYVAEFYIDSGAQGNGQANGNIEWKTHISTKYGDGSLITLPNANLSGYNYQVQRIAETNIQALNLRSDTPDSYYAKAYDDTGAIARVADGTAYFMLPGYRFKVSETVEAK
ncbi:MAG: carboxypeptidase-like regulatory domain-containing protein [Candidatus Diapherotrites archaeon]|nr:carboxypeptidase-like regulatory domain-containing protein [Candidatus Diapherotrites archaeon]